MITGHADLISKDQIQELKEFFLPRGWQVLDIKTKDQWALMVLTLDLS